MANNSDFYKKVGYNYAPFDDTGYTNLALKGEQLYHSNKDYYDNCLIKGIERLADMAITNGKPIVTTECWSVVDYKDWPLLNWDWILELNELGIRTAVSTGCYAGMATSNFCGPQFAGMWREKLWHKNMTRFIHESELS